MTKNEMLDIIHEMIVVDSEEGLICNTALSDESITAVTKDQDTFKITVTKL